MFRHTAIERHGTTVTRTASPWTPTIHSLLRHLDRVGFAGAPRIVGSGFDVERRETLTYIEGEIMRPGQPTVEAAAAVGTLLRELHEATASYQPPADALWHPWFGRELGGVSTVIGHCDAVPWNIVTRHGLPVALIDWDFAGPVDPLIEVAQACWLNANLYGDDAAEREVLPPLEERLRQVRALVDAYGLTRSQRRGFVDQMVEFAVYSIAADADEAGVTPETRESEALWGMTWKARSATWLLHHRRLLEAALR